MKKLKVFLVLSILIILLTSLVACSSKTYDVKAGEDLKLGAVAYNEMFYLSQAYANRSLSDKETEGFVDYIKAELAIYGYEVLEQSYTTDSNKAAKNIIAKKAKEGVSSKIVIGCNWDNSYAAYDEKPDGSYETGASIAALLTIADYLKDKDLNYNLELVFFAGANDGFSGAQYYMGKLTAQDKENIKLYINLGYIIGGDNQYIYARDKSVNYEDFISQVNEKNNLAFEKTPLFKNTFAATISEEQIYRYSHVGMFGNNIIFMNNTIPSINYLSINWKDVSQPIYVEKAGMDNVAGTANDTYDNMILRSKEEDLTSQMNNVINSIVDVVYVNQEALMPVLDDADEVNVFLQSDAAYYIFNVAIKIIAAVAIILIVVGAKNQIAKNREEYKKIKEASPINKVKAKEVTDLEELLKMAQEFAEEEEKKKNNDNKDDGDDNNISDDDVFQ